MEKSKFAIHERGKRFQQTYDPDTIEIEKAGVKINVYEFIQESREDTEIYPTLEKYGSLKRMELDTEGVYGDFREIKDLRSVYEQQKAADNMWLNLPIEVRKEFGHSKSEFMEKGENWLKNKIELKKEQTVIQPELPIEKVEKAEVSNG